MRGRLISNECVSVLQLARVKLDDELLGDEGIDVRALRRGEHATGHSVLVDLNPGRGLSTLGAESSTVLEVLSLIAARIEGDFVSGLQFHGRDICLPAID